MAGKVVRGVLYGPDRQVWDRGPVKLRVLRMDSRGVKSLWLNRPGEPRRSVIELEGFRYDLQLDLHFDAGQQYLVSLDAPRYRPAFHLINRGAFLRLEEGRTHESDETVTRIMLVPNQPRSTDLDEGYARLEERESPLVAPGRGFSRDQYLGFSDAAKMAFLNIEAKLRATLVRGAALISHVAGARRAAPDRLFILVRPSLKAIVTDSPDFVSAPGHESPGEPLPDHPDSWKHRIFGAGNIQLCFAEETEPWPSGTNESSYSVDADIDLEKGFKHFFEWLDNNVLRHGRKTEQAAVYSLLYSQNILPDYTIAPV
jgi:hypothetical protein